MSLDGKAVDKSIPIPLYYQVKTHLRELITQRADGESIPTEVELCEHFGVSRPTVRQAINELVNEGMLVRSKGKGTFVVKQKLQRDFLLTFETFDQEIIARGRTPETRVLSVTQVYAGEQVARGLSLSPGTSVYALRRLRLTNGTPLSYVTSYLPADLVPRFDEEPQELLALHKRLEEHYGYRLSRATRTIEAIGASADVAEHLDTEAGRPIQYIETTVYLETGRCIEHSNAFYRGDQSKFSIELHRSHLDTGARDTGVTP